MTRGEVQKLPSKLILIVTVNLEGRIDELEYLLAGNLDHGLWCVLDERLVKQRLVELKVELNNWTI